MGKKSPKVSDPFRNLQNQAFPGLTTPTFSLTRGTSSGGLSTGQQAAPATSMAAPGSLQSILQFRQGQRDRAGPGNFNNLAGNISQFVQGAGGGQGPFSLQRTNNFVPQTEQRLFGALEQNRQGIAGLRGGFQQAREGLNFFEDRIRNLLLPESAQARGRLEGLLQDVRPGFGRLTESLVEGVRNRAAQATGNLRSALNQRNVLGASFAQGQLASVAQDFTQEEERVRAEAFTQELQQSTQIIGQIGQFLELDQRTLGQQAQAVGLRLGLNEAEANLFSRELQNLQVQSQLLGQTIYRELQELGVSGSLINQAQATVAKLAGLQAQLDAQAAADSGGLFGTFLGLGASLLTAPGSSIFGGLFGGAAGGSAAAFSPVLGGL